MQSLQNFISIYNDLHSKAIEKFSPYLVREFNPQTFNNFGYTTQISVSDELWKFADCMHENRYEENLKLLHYSLDANEFDQLKNFVQQVLQLTSKTGNPVIIKNSILRAFLHVRAIKAIAVLKCKAGGLRILEIGPGSGYLGLLCREANFKYWSIEITQSLYLYQHYLWNLLRGTDLTEAMSSENISNKSFIHIPWWTIADNNFSLPKFDVITINHAINEMSPMSFRFYMERLRNSFDDALFLVEGWGGGNYHQNCNYLNEIGVSFIHQSNVSDLRWLPVSVFQISHKTDVEIGFSKLSGNAIRLKLKLIIKKIFRGTFFLLFLMDMYAYFKKLKNLSFLEIFCNNLVITKNSKFFINHKSHIYRDVLDDYYLNLKSNGYNINTKDEDFCKFTKSL
jgi:hypothetical protein